jgi:hypothetical protein
MNGWEAFDKFIGVQGVLALLMTGAVIVFLGMNRTVPPEAWSLLGVAWGFYFAKNGSKIMSDHVIPAFKGPKD